VDEEKLLDLAFQIVVAEEIARQTGNVKVQVEPVKVRPIPTHVVDRRNVVLEGEETVVRAKGCGALQEFVAKAEDTDFQILVEKDGETVVYGSYSDYAEISQDVEGIDAFADRDAEGNPTGAYVFKVNDVEFADSLTVTIRTDKPVRFRAVFCKYKASEA
jgi:hypothetical protein